MKMQNVALSEIVPNPWRDKTLFPIDADHVAELRESIHDHGFFGGVKGRRRNGKVEIGCGHARIEAARKAKLESVPIFLDDLDDDAMLRLMVDENATQGGANPGAVMNEVAAVTRRLIEGLLEAGSSTIVHKQAYESKLAVEQAIGKLKRRLVDPDAIIPIGINVITRYLGQGDPERSHRGERSIREAISALKQAGRYDALIDDALRKHPQPAVANKPSAKGAAIAKTKQATPHRRLLDERTANVFPNDHQFHAFREAVTTRAAQQAIPIDQQYALAKSIMKPLGAAPKKQIGAPYIKKMVQAEVQEGLKKQRNINKQERDLYMSEQREARIEDELRNANTHLRGLVSCIAVLIDLAEQFPAHPKIGGFSARLDTLVGAIQQLSKKIK
jgi:ParB/RepB/Spo0J family partition protein